MKKVGIFDSGIGGLTVLHQALRDLPGEEYIYYADTDHVPYGRHTRQEVAAYTEEAVAFLAGQGVKAIVIACNTATSAAIAGLRARYTLPIVGMEPAVKPAVALHPGKRVLVTATPVTVREEKLRDLLFQVDKNRVVDTLALPELVTFAERGEFTSPQVTAYLRAALAPYPLADYSALVLGCTHFNYFKDTFSALLPPGTALIDGSQGTIRRLAALLGQQGLLAQPGGRPAPVAYYYSGRRVEDQRELARFAHLHARLEAMLAF